MRQLDFKILTIIVFSVVVVVVLGVVGVVAIIVADHHCMIWYGVNILWTQIVVYSINDRIQVVRKQIP